MADLHAGGRPGQQATPGYRGGQHALEDAVDEMEQPLGWGRLKGATLPELVTVPELVTATGLSRGTVSRQLGRGRWGIDPVGRVLGSGALRYPLAAVLERAAGPGKGNRTAGESRAARHRRCPPANASGR